MGVVKNLARVAILVAVAGTAGMPGGFSGQAGPHAGDESRKWNPNNPVVKPSDYAGAGVCAECHDAIGALQSAAPMAGSTMRPNESPFLRDPKKLTFEQWGYTYTIEKPAGQLSLSVTSADGKTTAPIVLAFGAGVVHQNFLLQHNDHFHLARVSYYTADGKLEQWANAPPGVPATLEAALGQVMPLAGLRKCLHCHGANTVVGDGFDFNSPGTHCETCHGPGARHVAAMNAGHMQETLIFNPAHLTPEEEVDFCGSCHSNAKQRGTTVQSVKNQDLRGVRTVLSQPYRLVSSRCWNSNDARSRCTFCHSPHQALIRDAGAYDVKCLACHPSGAQARADQPGKTCPVGSRQCTTCHMPQIEVPGTRSSYTDHRIRIARAGETYPD